MNEKFLCFDSDVVDAVYNKFGGKYTKDQIRDVMDCSIGYLHHVMTYTDCVKLNIPGLCAVYANKEQLIKRKRFLDGCKIKNHGCMASHIKDEYAAIEGKLEAMENKEYDVLPVNRKMSPAIRALKSNKSWDYIQKFQNKIQF